tara:strand:- start:1427 stop:2008 length:582 start_codon:yes stop_codon:yes gene_type:complete
MWSGGIDSTYVLAKMLRETNHNIFAHHIYLKNVERRDVAEAWAIQKLGDKLNKIRPFKFTFNHIDDSQMPTMVYDMARVCFEAGAVSKAIYHSPMALNIDKWTIGTHEKEGHNWERWEFIKHATRAAEWTKGRERFIEFELPEMVTKKEEMRYLKEYGLLDDCWYCRTPIPDVELKIYKPCGVCKTCHEVKEV